jgi:hypothetical protein
VAFKKTLRRGCICCLPQRSSPSNSLGLPPATPSGESRRTSSNLNRLKNNKLIRSITNIGSRQVITSNNLSLGNAALEASNGNLTIGGTSLSSKRNSCL